MNDNQNDEQDEDGMGLEHHHGDVDDDDHLGLQHHQLNSLRNLLLSRDLTSLLSNIIIIIIIIFAIIINIKLKTLFVKSNQILISLHD